MTGEHLMNLVLACLGPRWGTHDEWQDIAAQAHLEAWRGYQRAGLHGAWLGAERGPTEWFRHWLGQAYRQGEARPAAIPFSQIERGDDGQAEPFEPAVESFEASLLDRFEAEAWLAMLSPLQREVVTRLVYRQETHAECAGAIRHSVASVSQALYGARKKAKRGRFSAAPCPAEPHRRTVPQARFNPQPPLPAAATSPEGDIHGFAIGRRKSFHDRY